MGEPSRAPASKRASKKAATERARAADEVELSLSIAKEGLGLSLGAPVKIGPVEVLDLALLLPGLKFPLDVSGGVARFRHRRGQLERLTLALSYEEATRWARERLAGIIGPHAPDVTVSTPARGAKDSDAVTVCLTDPDELRALAFDLVPKTRGRTLLLVLSRARGARLTAPPTALALSALRRLAPAGAVVDGAICALGDLGAAVTRAVLPDAGARLPDASLLQSTAFSWNTSGLVVRLSSDADAHDASARAATDIEMATTLRDADELLATRAFDRARAALLSILVRAPRAPEVCQRLAEIDAWERDRAESALATLAESDPARPLLVGTLRGELYLRAGRTEDAIAAVLDGADAEPQPAIAGMMLALAADLRDSPSDALSWLDRAVARAPHLDPLRKKRLVAALKAGRLDTARADVGHLEAKATRPSEKHDALVGAARAFQDAGAWVESRALLERALRYAPDSPQALARLGMALVTEGRTARGAALLSEAVEREPFADAVLALAGALATLGDRPSAIARLASLGPDSPAFVKARAMEASLREELGDLSGASMVYARIREYAEARAEAGALDALAAAERFERSVRGDTLAADRHAAAKKKLDPRIPPPATRTATPTSTSTLPSGTSDAVDAHARCEALKEALRAAPRNVEVVIELAGLLADTGQTHDLVALAFARLDEGDLARTGDALRSSLARAEKAARDEGRAADASLLSDARAALGS
jgi:tetratricopeptide (TPR) repeat protein